MHYLHQPLRELKIPFIIGGRSFFNINLFTLYYSNSIILTKVSLFLVTYVSPTVSTNI